MRGTQALLGIAGRGSQALLEIAGSQERLSSLIRNSWEVEEVINPYN